MKGDGGAKHTSAVSSAVLLTVLSAVMLALSEQKKRMEDAERKMLEDISFEQ